MEQGRALRRAKYGKASYQGQDNYRALTWLTRSHLGVDVGLQQLQLLPKPVWPCKLFKSRISTNSCEVILTTLSVQVYG